MTLTPEEDQEVTRLLREFDEAVADEQDAASRAASAADELHDLGVDVGKIRPEWESGGRT